MLSRDAILKADDLPKETVAVPEWGGEVTVMAMSGALRDEYEDVIYIGEDKNLDNIAAKLCVFSIVDADGELVFSILDIEKLSKKNGAALERVFDVARRLSGIGSQEVAGLKKNSPITP